MAAAKKTGLSGAKSSVSSDNKLTKVSNISSNLNMNFDVAPNKMIFLEVSSMLQAQFKAVGVDFDPTTIKLTDQNFNQTIKKLTQTADIISTNAKLLPDMVKLCKKLSQGARQLSEAQRDIVLNTLEEQHGIDAAQADVLLALANFGKARNAIQEKLEAQINMVRQSDAARFAVRETTHSHQLNVLNQSSDLIKATQQRQLEATKNAKVARNERKKAAIEYVEVARV